jgi:oligopeptidase B
MSTKKKAKLLIPVILMISFGCRETRIDQTTAKPPMAEKIRKELTIHDRTRVDNYYWLNERDNPKVMEYLEAENRYTDSVLGHTKEFQEELYDEMVGRIKQTDTSVPYRLNGYYYYTRYEEEKEHPVYCRKRGSLGGAEEIVLNVNEMAEGHKFYRVAGRNVSPNTKLLAYGVDTLSRRIYTIRFKDVSTGKILDDKIPNTDGSAVWANDNKTVYYTVQDEALRPYKIFKHVLGTDASRDVEVFHEADSTFTTYVEKTKSEKYLIIASHSTLSSEYRFLDADDPDGKFKIIQPREKDHEYTIRHYGDKFYIKTNYKAKNFRLVATPVSQTTKEHWKEVIPHRQDVLLQYIEIFKNYLIVSERKNGLPQIRIIPWEDGEEYYIDFGEETYYSYVSSDNREFDTDVLRYGYTSLTMPLSTFDYNMKTRKDTLMKRQEVVGDFGSNNYHAERHHAVAGDGVRIPISLVYKKGLEKNGNNPLLLYGYGSYGISRDPIFSSERLSLLNRGFVYAIAHVRGGEEMGRQWYEDGKLLKKKNTFTDFIACAEYLIDQNLTNTTMLFAYGGSAGGLLVGAVANMRPDLFKGIVAAVPFVDIITTMLDEKIPLTIDEFDEWGNPRERKYYDYILSYSPYDNVEAKAYPAMLVTTGFHDSQVQYWEPAKWVAKLRALKTDSKSLILHTNLHAGHGGASGRFERHKETALQYAFVLDQVGMHK